MRVIIDKFEGKYAIVELENKNIVNMPRVLIPNDAAEGDCLYIEVDKEYTKLRKEQIRKLMDDVWAD